MARGSCSEVEKQGAITFHNFMDRENEITKMFIISLGNKFELESTARSQTARTLEQGLLNQPISYTSYYVIAKVGHCALGCNTKYTLSRSLGDIALALKVY